MKKFTLFLFIQMTASFCIFAQPTSGLLAHWDMNGTTNDITTGGHNGHGNNLTPAVGRDGVAGHAWYFNGTNSSITIPYSPDMNVNGFTIATTIMVKGFYMGTCHGNILYIRGKTNVANGSYFFQFTDYPAGYGCTTAIDTNQESFMPSANGAGLGFTPPAPFTAFNHIPHVISNKWYTAVVTFNDTVFKVYVNDTLMTTVASPYPGTPMGINTDSAGIGYSPYDNSVGYPYYFKGIMDDMKFYNRALSPCEVSKLTYWVNTLITANPINDTTLAGGIATFSISDTGSAAYQWQVNPGTGFINCPASAPYSGVTTKILTVSPVTGAMNNYQYRCVRNSGSGCVDTSGQGKLVVDVTGINTLQKQDISIVPNPGKNMIAVTSSGIIEKIEITNLVGQKLITEKANKPSVLLDVSSLAPGMYIFKINDSYTEKFIKE